MTGERLEIVHIRRVDEVATLGGRGHDDRVDGRRPADRREALAGCLGDGIEYTIRSGASLGGGTKPTGAQCGLTADYE